MYVIRRGTTKLQKLKEGVDAQEFLEKYPQYMKVTTEYPSEEQIEEWVFDSVCEATDGCTVEPDGICPHGHPSWLLALGLI